MNKNEFASVMKTLGIAFNKEITQELLVVYYEVLKDENIETLKNVAKQMLQNKRFFPTIAELVEECKAQRTKNGFAILDYMKAQGYFKESTYAISEYDKAYKWLETGVIPEWFKEDMKKYNKQKKMLETKENKILIGG